MIRVSWYHFYEFIGFSYTFHEHFIGILSSNRCLSTVSSIAAILDLIILLIETVE